MTRELTITLTDEDRAQAARWTADHFWHAAKQDWYLFDYDCTGALQIRCSDELDDKLNGDEEAIRIAKAQAAAGCEIAKLALELDLYFKPIIYGPDWASKIRTKA